ncbi:MAG: ABC transporter permease [Leptospiraceae bacterium]|nr:ABC transporter permease [Leptospiraceae bacterium]MDW7975257.1 ABC transporter permease [Leptospiraceae bacterium]
MWKYILRRILYTIPIAIGVYTITFLLFHLRDPIAIAKVHLPQAPLPVLQDWVRANNYHLPLFLNLPHHAEEVRPDGRVHPEFKEKSIFYSRYFLGLKDLITFNFGKDKNNRDILEQMKERAIPSLSVMFPAFVISIFISLFFSLLSVYSPLWVDRTISFFAVVSMSIAIPVYLLLAGWIFGSFLKIVPIYGDPLPAIIVAVIAGLGGQIRFYRTVLMDQKYQLFVRASRLRGATTWYVLIFHVLRNASIPILTTVMMSLPFLITGSLLLEQFFGIPGMGDMMYSAIISQDFPVIRALVYLGAFLYMLGNVLTDISYAFVDPRIRLE